MVQETYLLSSIIKFATLIVCLAFILPIQIQEMRFANGTRPIRVLLLIANVIVIVNQLILLHYSIANARGHTPPFDTSTVSLFNSLSFLLVSIMLWLVYIKANKHTHK